MPLASRKWLLPAIGTVLVAAAIVVAILASSGGGGGSRTLGAAPGGRGATKGLTDDPSSAYEAAASAALPSVVQIQRSDGLGSGIVFDKQGDIVTNAHVVAGEKRFVVVAANGKRYDATLRGSFSPGDVALPSVVQTSAAINPGNSGGALVDLHARVVGVPTLAATDPELGGTAPGVGFAISSNEVKSIASQLVQSGRVTRSDRAYLGVELGSLSEGGVLVVGVQRNGPAAKAGIKPGDIIQSVDGAPVGSVDDLATALAAHKPGDSVRVKVVHQNGKTQTVDVTLGRLPAG